MTKDDHDRYIAEIEGLQGEVEKLRFKDLELTRDEAEALDGLNPKYQELVENQIGRYTPSFPRYDFIQLVVEKAMARYILGVLPLAEDAYKMGVRTTE